MNKDRIKELEEEVEESSMQESLDYYIDGLDEQSVEYCVNDILQNLKQLKQTHPHFFA